MEYLIVGTIVRTIGLKGEVKIYPSTHFRDSRFSKGSHVFLLNENKEIEEDLLIVKHAKNGECDNLIFEGYDTIEKAEKLLKKDLYGQNLQLFRLSQSLQKSSYHSHHFSHVLL